MAKQSGLTLSDMTQYGRQGVKIVIAFFVAMIVGRFALESAVSLWNALNPPPPPPPTVGFGLLPQIEFPAKAESELPASYQLELPRGQLPSFGDRAKVFYIPEKTLGLLSDEQARSFAAKYDFVFEPTVVSPTVYRWRKSSPLESTLQLDIKSYQMRLTTNYLNRPDLLSATLPDAKQAEQIVKNFMRVGSIGDSSIATASAETQYLRLQGTELVEALSYSDADFVQVGLNRFPIDGIYEMFTPNGLATVQAIVSGGLSNTDAVVDFTSNFYPKDESQVHTYPIRSASQAWSILQAGEGYVARFKPSSAQLDQAENGTTAVIRSVTLGYFDHFEHQPFLQPVYVFRGDDQFLGYVPAIDPRFFQPKSVAE